MSESEAQTALEVIFLCITYMNYFYMACSSVLSWRSQI